MNLDVLKVHTERIENIFVMRLEGAINSLTYQEFIDEIKGNIRRGGLILDLEEIALVSSVGITALKEVYDMSYKSGNRVVLLNLSNHVKQVFQMMGMAKIFNVAPNEELAMKMASKPLR
jgi:anti-anti-sigma factor